MPPRASLKAFLETARAALTAAPSKRPVPITFVVGNESADLDSLCSALLLAYFHTYAPPTTAKWARAGALHIPVCHLHRADLALRPEFTAVLRAADVRGEDVFTLEDILPQPQNDANNPEASKKDSTQGVKEEGGGESIRPEDTRWLLVDHNAMTGSLAKAFGSRVIGCVDHHADEGVIPRDAEIRFIEKSGSCASLVIERCAEVWDALATATPQSKEDKKIDAHLARLALGPILIDTSNLEDRNKTTAHDEQAVALAEAKIRAYAEWKGDGDGGDGVEEKAYDRNAFFKSLSALKEDLSEMSFRDIFRKDYKEWSVGDHRQKLKLGTSSVPQGLSYLVDEKAGGNATTFIEELGNWGVDKVTGSDVKAEKKKDLVVVLTAFKDQDEDGKFCRELLVWARTEAGVRAAKLFEERNKDKLKLRTWGGGKLDGGIEGENGNEWRRAWMQGAVEFSRKQIAPMLRDALEEVSGS
ncbi:exopolyphosphatase-like protein [Xylariaceae sp. AK1471]|nr:exopolyphosphatase-like protein [Xylariaceae sp. AK1471]